MDDTPPDDAPVDEDEVELDPPLLDPLVDALEESEAALDDEPDVESPPDFVVDDPAAVEADVEFRLSVL